MARPPKYRRQEVEQQRSMREILIGLAQRKLSPERAAAELGISAITLRKYLDDFGGHVGTERFIVMPALDDLLEISHADRVRLPA